MSETTDTPLQEFHSACNEFFDSLSVFDYIKNVDSMKECLIDPEFPSQIATVLYPLNKNIIDCCKKKKASYSFFNQLVLFQGHLEFRVFVQESKKTKQTIVKHLSNILSKSLPLVKENILQKSLDLDIPPELSKLVSSVTDTFSETDMKNMDPMKLFMSNSLESSSLFQKVQENLKNIDQEKILKEVVQLVQRPDFLNAISSTFSQQPDFLGALNKNSTHTKK